MIKDLYSGLRYLIIGFSLIRQRGIRRFVALPLAVNVLVFGALLWFGGDWFAGVLREYLPTWLDIAALKYLLWIVFGGAMLLIAFYTFVLLANFIAAPFNGVLAERVEQTLTGNKPPSSGRVLAVFATIAEAFLTEFRKLLYLLMWMLPFAVLMVVPGLAVVVGPCWLLFSSWLLALEYIDYPASNHEIRFRDLRQRLRKRRALALGFGGAVVAATMIPVLNLFVMPAAVAGGTALWVSELGRSD
jgi:CysZ protein